MRSMYESSFNLTRVDMKCGERKLIGEQKGEYRRSTKKRKTSFMVVRDSDNYCTLVL
jgi:hypothetical protein